MLGTWLVLCPGGAHAESSNEEAATARICTAGPTSAVARAQILKGDAEVTAAGVLPNPDLILQHQRGLAGPEDHETIAGLSVPLGIGGRWFLLNDAAEARRDQAQATASATLFDGAITFRRAYARAALDKARLEVLVAQQAALDSLSDTIKALVEGEEVAPYDLLRQQAQARLHQRSVESMKARTVAIHRWLEVWAAEKVNIDTSSLLELAGGKQPLQAMGANGPRSAHPLVRSLEAAARANAIEAQAARRRWVPDLFVFAGYRTATSAGMTGQGIAIGLTMPLTFFDHGQGEAQQADAAHQLAAAKASLLEREQSALVSAKVARLSQLETSAVDLDQMVRDTATLRAKARLLYSADEASIAELLDAYLVTEAAQLSRIDAVEEIVNARFDLMRTAGTQFNAVLDEVCGDNQQRGPR